MTKKQKEDTKLLAEKAGGGCFYVMLWLIIIPIFLNGLWRIYAINKRLPVLSFWFWFATVWLLRFIIGKLLNLSKNKK